MEEIYQVIPRNTWPLFTLQCTAVSLELKENTKPHSSTSAEKSMLAPVVVEFSITSVIVLLWFVKSLPFLTGISIFFDQQLVEAEWK
jgi:hypothetical protein